ncbi:class I SAM-dependent methyltransferase [Taklimakanibacter deserti]|uniref:class I SAM-dependent methyltransferase n=1 Tax=Taklimakanibacter deserti TaxID=2267839 RepID=UPI0034D614CD
MTMTQPAQFDAWSAGQNYEHYMGRWSRQMASEFLRWLSPPRRADWLEIGCGTGALTATLLSDCNPKSILAIEPSKDFIAYARSMVTDKRVTFEMADAGKLPAPDAVMDVVTSALVLNFIPDKLAALAEMKRVLKPQGLLSFYVWDYPGGGMGFIDEFWKAAGAIDEKAKGLDEAKRFPFCTREGLANLCREAGLPSPAIEPLEIETVFADFESFWRPFTLGAGPAPGYCLSLPEDRRAWLKARLAENLGREVPIRLMGRAWAVKALAQP